MQSLQSVPSLECYLCIILGSQKQGDQFVPEVENCKSVNISPNSLLAYF